MSKIIFQRKKLPEGKWEDISESVLDETFNSEKLTSMDVKEFLLAGLEVSNSEYLFHAYEKN